MNLVAIVLLLLQISFGRSTLWGSSKFRQGRVLGISPVRTISVNLLTTCVQICRETTSCISLQYNVSLSFYL